MSEQDERLAMEAENRKLREVAKDLHWLARRYADGRSSYATSLHNDHTRTLLSLGVPLNPTGDGTLWARDRDGRAYDGLTDEEAAQGRPLPENAAAWRGEEVAQLRAEREADRARLAALDAWDAAQAAAMQAIDAYQVARNHTNFQAMQLTGKRERQLRQAVLDQQRAGVGNG